MDFNFFNLSRRKKRDVLSELLTDKVSEGIISKKELNSLVKLISDSSISASEGNKKALSQTKSKQRLGKRKSNKKITLSISKEVFENLDRARDEIKNIVPDKLLSNVSRSKIVYQAINLILEEYNKKGKKSSLVRSILQKN